MPLEFNCQEREKFFEAIKSAFPQINELKRLVDFRFDKKLDSIARGNNEEVIFGLIEWAESEGKLEKLIEVVCNKKPGNHKLKDFHKYLSKTLRDLLDPYKFDLNRFIEDCSREVYPRRGLVGIVLPCKNERFRKIFCERLKKEICEDNVENRVVPGLNRLSNSMFVIE